MMMELPTIGEKLLLTSPKFTLIVKESEVSNRVVYVLRGDDLVFELLELKGIIEIWLHLNEPLPEQTGGC